ncbi:hypothetical protein [Nonomuraea longicatena]|uniref:Secreted protein n=1 Tax=Nonomuraea longicatena TaxID=83682 RepID=A0ABP4AR02_9ACTN
MSTPLRMVVAAVGVTAVIAVAVTVVRMVSSSATQTGPPAPTSDTGVQTSPTAHRVDPPAPDRSYWTEERMREANPAPAPIQEE